jgi:hypothetical protein
VPQQDGKGGIKGIVADVYAALERAMHAAGWSGGRLGHAVAVSALSLGQGVAFGSRV